MKATAGTLPTGDDWVVEVKWDGMRAVVGIDGGLVRLQSANGNDVTAAFPELAELGTALGIRDGILDGEIVAFDDTGRPDFGRLQSRMHVTSPRVAAERASLVPCVLVVFDLLALDGRSLVELTWTERRRLLDALVEPGPHWQISPVHDDGAALFEAVRDEGLEGVVAKRRNSRYRPGRRTAEWVKVKVRHRQEFVVGGWAPGSGGRADRIGGLLLGVHDDPGGPLRYVGRAGSGLDEETISRLEARFASLGTTDCPFSPAPPPAAAAGVRWVEPRVVVEVAFAEWTAEGRLRHPTVKGLRIDVDPDTVGRAP